MSAKTSLGLDRLAGNLNIMAHIETHNIAKTKIKIIF
jgi:hypothetical protein